LGDLGDYLGDLGDYLGDLGDVFSILTLGNVHVHVLWATSFTEKVMY
jgi:hypothetical protein